MALANPARSEGYGGKVVGYYADWTSTALPVQSIPFDKLTHLNYAFAVLDASQQIKFDTATLLSQVVTAAHQKDVKVIFSVGGWTGSVYFSPMASQKTTRAAAISNMVQLVDTYKLDGIDLDWEFPGRTGSECNIVDKANDTPNLLLLLQELRAALDKKFGEGQKLITMAVRVQPFDINGVPSTDLKEYVQYLDFINIMAYDIFGSWAATTGPNAPFESDGIKNTFSYVQSITDWLAAGFPPNKLVAGLAMYGRTMLASGAMTSSDIYTTQVKQAVKGDKDDAVWQGPCNKDPAQFSTVWKYKNLRSEGILANGNTTGAGWTRNWDTKSQTPWLFNEQTKNFISYDDPTSLRIKVDYARQQQLGGVMANGESRSAPISTDAVTVSTPPTRSSPATTLPKCRPRV
ncbi:glycoside hydrolase [Dimargaris cristalligena]|uniref:Glycoside hydrolase n=1 Tax=Dimargaris cristalligena TaxID=215637 RepID=A0A4P9ZUA0_9FUNG|nr:glycoside hydrolase [Dimargaris cristalligena]|eukprot:RKP37176.1 glycoside hydrolase [Dimargaris cristalligena]